MFPLLSGNGEKRSDQQLGSMYQGRIQDFLKGGSESGVDIEGGANPSIVSLKLGGCAPQKLWGI